MPVWDSYFVEVFYFNALSHMYSLNCNCEAYCVWNLKGLMESDALAVLHPQKVGQPIVYIYVYIYI
jgi:hypothetical protein